MHWETVIIGFISGLVSGFMLLAGAWLVLLPRVPALLRREALRDLSHYGRDVGKIGARYIFKLLTR
ncbi:MAG: hypothetical protein WA705_03805 [Candidatus Ozemobacteraceae bacterium]